MGNNYKSKAERLKGDPYTGVCFQALETLECLCLIHTRVNYCNGCILVETGSRHL